MRGHHPRSLGWASLRLNLAGYRLAREIGRATGLTRFLEAILDRLEALLRRLSGAVS